MPGTPARLVGPADRAGPGLDTTAILCLRQCAGRLPGHYRPGQPAPGDGQPYGSRFPQVTVRDLVRLQHRLVRALGVQGIAAVIGGSLGGMQVLEWAVLYPRLVRNAITIGVVAGPLGAGHRLQPDRARGDHARPGLAGRRLLRHGPQPGARPRAWRA